MGASKIEFFQKMSSDEAIALRLAEAACGSKWKQSHATHLVALKEKFPQYTATFDKLGITNEMTSTQVLDHIKEKHVCDKKAKTKIFRALEDDEPGTAAEAMAGKFVITM